MAYTDAAAETVVTETPSADLPVPAPLLCAEEARLIRAYAGKNGDLYVATLERMFARDRAFGETVYEWNWAAFFGLLAWSLYRKMWLFAAAVMIGPALVETLLIGHPVALVNILVACAATSASKSLYVRSALRRIRKLRARGLCDDELLARLEGKGRSRIGLVVGLILTAVANFVAIGHAFSALPH
jgi:hypothetical protein